MIEIIRKILSSTIGFRTKKKINMIIASCYYIFFLIVSVAMGKGFLFGLVFTFTCPILVFSVIEIITKRKIRPLLDISICFLLIIAFAFTVPSQQTELSSNNINNQTTIQNNNDTEKIKNNQNENKEETIETTSNILNESDPGKEKTTENSDTEKIKNNQNENTFRKPAEKKIDENGIIYPINRVYNMGKTLIKIKNVKVKASGVTDYDFIMEYEITNNTDTYMDWKFKYDNYLGKITASDKTWNLSEAGWIKDDDIKHERISRGSFGGKEVFLGALAGHISNSIDSYEPLFENQEIHIILKYTQDTYKKNNTREIVITLNEKEQYLPNNVDNEYFREAVNREIDNDGFIYNVNKTYNIGMTEITVNRFIIRTSLGKYIVTMEYVINNNDNLPINWKFSGTNKGNMIGTIVTNGRERIWMGKASNYTDKYIDQHIESGTLQAKSEFTAAVNFSFDTQYEDPKLKENEMMDFTIYYSQNNIDSELSIIINEK